MGQWTGEPLDDLLTTMHGMLRGTRGAVVGAAIIDRPAGRFYYAGVGNVLVRVFGAPERASSYPRTGLSGPVSANCAFGVAPGQRERRL